MLQRWILACASMTTIKIADIKYDYTHIFKHGYNLYIKLLVYFNMPSDNHNTQKKVNFLIAGVQKGGTTVLDQYLRHHPEINMANKKEVHFFDNERLFYNNASAPDYDLYHSNFSDYHSEKILGESTPIYSYWKPSLKRIFDYNPEMKLIILLRNPIERAYSHWNKEKINFHSYANSQSEAVETLSFLEALQNEKQRCAIVLPLQHRYYSYIDRGLYSEQLKYILKFFPMKQLLLLKSEWLRHDTELTMEKVYQFLSIKTQTLPSINAKSTPVEKESLSSPVDSPDSNPFNVGHYKTKMTEQEKDFLRKAFSADISELESMLNWDCGDWLM